MSNFASQKCIPIPKMGMATHATIIKINQNNNGKEKRNSGKSGPDGNPEQVRSIHPEVQEAHCSRCLHGKWLPNAFPKCSSEYSYYCLDSQK